MELVLVRHGLPLRVDAAPDGGPADPGLAERGHEQAGRIVAALEHEDVTAVIASPARRARETAAPLAAALGLVPDIEPGVAEFDVDDPSYVPVEELRAAGDPRWFALLRGELYSVGVDPQQFRERVARALERIATAHPSGRVVVFCHAGVVNVATGVLLRQERDLWFAPAYCSLTRVAFARDGRRSVLSLNETGHVRDLL